MFRHVNGEVSIGDFRCPEAEFAVIEPAYGGLPAGVIERRYDPQAPGGRPKHVVILAGPRQTGGEVPWPDGDAMLAKAEDFPALHAAAFPLPPEEPEPEEPRHKPQAPPDPTGTTIAQLRTEVAAMRQALIAAGVWED